MQKILTKITATILIFSFFAIYIPKQASAASQSSITDIALQCGLVDLGKDVLEGLGIPTSPKEVVDLGKNLLATEAKEEIGKEIGKEIKKIIPLPIGGSVPVYDADVKITLKEVVMVADRKNAEKVQEKIKTASVENCLLAIKDFALKVALARLKKQLLDRIADQTLEWINNDFRGQPRFITNFGDVFDDSYQAAVGDVARDIGLGKLCDEKLSLKLQLNLRAPTQKKFTQDASCTLDKIVGNINSFKDDFRNGGWIGYTESLSPSNNRFGLELLAMDQMYSLQQKNEKVAAQEASTGSGFNGEKVCDRWRLDLVDKTTKVVVPQKIYLGFISEFPDPRKPLQNTTGASYEDGLTLAAKLSVQASLLNSYDAHGSGWICDHTYINTPGDTARTALQNTFTQDQSYITSAENLEDYINVIFDAAVTRLINNGVKGIVNAGKGLFKDNPDTQSNFGANREGTAYGDTKIQDSYYNSRATTDILDEAAKEKQKEIEDLNDKIRQQDKTNLQTRFNAATSSFKTASSSVDAAKISLDKLDNKLVSLSNCEQLKSSLAAVCLSTRNEQQVVAGHRTSLGNTYILLASTTQLISQVQQPLSAIPDADIQAATDRIVQIETNISSISNITNEITTYSVSKDAEISSLLNMCLNATTYDFCQP
ncbi:MAG: hypothetical protein WC842_01335 [Candidatus Paceibacterota bacterium]|jgi:hypothetical protein